MATEDSRYPQDWLRIAEKDLSRVERCLFDGDPELAGFCLQQSIEKFLKAFLLKRGWELRRTHDLEALLDDAVVHEAACERFRLICQKITKYYTLQRYPLAPGIGVTEEDVRDALEAARELIEQIRADTR